MRGYKKYRVLNNLPANEASRYSYPLRMCGWIAEDTARRVAASKKAFPWKFLRGDCHSHTQHSDGIGTVAETAEMAKAAGLDFQFVTDHWGVTQAPECIKHGLWYGQEPATALHHMLILGLDHAFTPQKSFLEDIAAARALGATVVIPHPTGWWPVTVYNEEQRCILEELPSPILMEICNGAHNIVAAFDYTDDSAIALWDHLIMQGKTVHVSGNTDAHAPHAIGMVWNGVFVNRRNPNSVRKALEQGHNFVSDAPLVHLALGAASMGDTASATDRRSKLQVTAVDSRGLQDVAIITDGQTRFTQLVGGTTKFELAWAIPRNVRRYVRFQARSVDGRRGYTNAIYLS